MHFYICFSVSFIIALVSAKPIISYLTKIKSLQSFRELGPRSHIAEKTGTPTMGGWIFLLPIFLLGITQYFQSQLQVVLLVLTAIFFGAVIGASDDLLKIIKSNYKGISSIQKLVIQFVSSSILVYFSGRYLFADISSLPEIFHPILIAWEFIWAFLVIAGASNAVNLSDGLDGLAGGLLVIAFASFVPLFWSEGEYSYISFCLIIIGALIAFLIFNFKPARIFMGDTGSLALGMGLGALAYLTHKELYLLVFAAVPVIETVSVILQVASAKWSRKYLGRDWRIFKMAPLHHHFELCGLNEVVVVLMFWAVQILISFVFIWFFTV
jgi:phospho-N-acetylmuramoyl-pentapeptide-transferase